MAPYFSPDLTDQFLIPGTASSYTLPQVVDYYNESVSIQVLQGQSMVFTNFYNNTFYFAPNTSDIGTYQIKIKLTDTSGVSSTYLLNMTVA